MNIVILGAGTAGLVSALILREKYPTYPITVVKSGEIGIIGVGEGSTEHWRQFMDFVGLEVSELVTETDATVKIGILFKNWSDNTPEYVHSISSFNFSTLNRPELFHHLLLSNKSKFPLSPHFENVYYKNRVHNSPTLLPSNQFHFDTFKLNAYLVKKCKERDISFIDAVINDVEIDTEGQVTGLISDTVKITGDFFIDCSGFRRIISTKLGTKWITKEHYLPLNRAIAFPTELHDKSEIEPYTTSTALSAGWCWKIPTQTRYGNGYVFNTNYLSADEAQFEMGKHLGINLEKVGRDIKFSAGKIDKFWNKNVVSVGLSSSFAEPLEAQSIGFSIIQSFTLIDYLDTWQNNTRVTEKYNQEMDHVFDNVVDYLQLHYLGKKEDTPFWRDKPFELTDFNKENLTNFNRGIVDQTMFKGIRTMFNTPNYYQVLAGLDMIDKNYLIESFSKNRENYNSVNIEATTNVLRSINNEYVISHAGYLSTARLNYNMRYKNES